ncbi:MAG: RluA family pseudouridine synthase [Lentisphaeria bacterium]
MNKLHFLQQIISATTPLPGLAPYQISRQFSIKGAFHNKSLISFLMATLGHLGEKYWRQAIVDKRLIALNQNITPESTLPAGTKLIHIVNDFSEPHVNNNIELIYEDNEILVVNKPAPLPMHPCGRFNYHCLENFIKLAFPHINLKIVHRLDADTTGIVILAKNSNTANFLTEQFRSQQSQKTYLALCHGITSEHSFSCHDAIGKNAISSGIRALDSINGLPSETLCEVIKYDYNKNLTLLKVIPKTGRTNQIRIHLSSKGFPIVGDQGYANKNPYQGPLVLEHDSLCLHAWQLSIKHPTTHNTLNFSATPPPKFSLIP